MSLFAGVLCHSQPGQVNVPRVDLMSDLPTPYNLRDWKEVAIQYDSFIYNESASGQYLPLISYNQQGVNYPSQKRISLHTYVGTFSPQNSEGINVLPSLVGASLVGKDIRTSYGRDRLLMMQDFFNKANGQNIYLNNSSANSGGDWWYDVMPNVYFFQLYDLHPNFNAEADFQFQTIAGRFHEAVQAMGGSATPWSPAYMNYRAWNFKTMEPNASGVIEPETAGTFGWLLYHAYKITEEPEYLKSAEWSMEFLNGLTSNPSYELQLPYGTYVAARMNAEIGTNYDIEKMVNWSFDRGPLRGWGTIVGEWGGFDVSGLVGEANDGGNDYAFLMNGVQQAAALVPMVRYDKRFARAIGKWMVNLSNASRLFYPGFLLPAQQDGSAWATANDPQKVVAHESMREIFQGLSPYSTGDALGGGWAATNLALYGSSSVGYLGAIVHETNVDKILQLNLNVTDFYADESYPSYLYFNPYDTPQSVLVDLGTGTFDLYEALSETFVQEEVTGLVSVIIPAKEAVLIVMTPPGGVITYDQNRMLIDGVVTDYMQSQVPFQHRPRIKALAAKEYIVESGKTVNIYCTAEDIDSEQLIYQWSATRGEIEGDSEEVLWTAPENPGEAIISVKVMDAEGNNDSTSIILTVVEEINRAPVIENLVASSLAVNPEEIVTIICSATDANGDSLTYNWSASAGMVTGTGSTIQWIAPQNQGSYQIEVEVSDGRGLSSTETVSILVKVFEGDGEMIAWYPFNGNADDHSGNELHGTPRGAILTVDHLGNQSSAYYFNGGSQHIEVENDSKLNFENGITVSLRFKTPLSGENEQFLISHGSWQNRWKLSITPTGNIRWTINSSVTIADLDNNFVLAPDQFYHVVATYDGATLMLYIDGELNAFKTLTGTIKTTDFQLLIGQMLPDVSDYNFKGVIDEVIIYDYALNPDEVQNIYMGNITGSEVVNDDDIISIYPNPALHTLHFKTPEGYVLDEDITLSVTNVTGQNVIMQTRLERPVQKIDISSLKAGLYFLTIKGLNGKKIKGIKFIKS
jgi:hypothetical protein